ncbi:MAG: zinc ABC transporter ATP-binding protein AztA [Nitriliruptoraceae bacterium]
MGIIPNAPAHRRASSTSGGRETDGTVVERPRVEVTVDGLQVGYDGHVALSDVDLRIHGGQVVAVIGPNGAGKSTLLSTIAGLITPDLGSVRVDGRAPRASRSRIAYVMQATAANESVPLTVRETVRMGRYATSGAFRPLTSDDRAAVDSAIDRMAISSIAGRQLHELSGGQRQRTFIAQGLAQRADVLLLDEPITGLDLVTQQVITDVIAQERDQGRVVILTTHDIGTARSADIVVLMAGRIVAAGPAAQVLTPSMLDEAYGGHAHLLDDGTMVLDDPHQHGSPEH